MAGLYGLAVLGKVLTLVWSAVRLPARVASHFGASGAADGWSSRTDYLVLNILITVLVVVGIPAIGMAATRGSGMGLNIPHKEYWLLPENRPELSRRLRSDLAFFAAVTAMLLAWIDVLVVRANDAAAPGMGGSSWVALGAYLVVVLGWTVWMMTKRYAVPAS
jgi:hypothetical protein